MLDAEILRRNKKNMEIITPQSIKHGKPQAQIKILGYLFNGRGNIDNQVQEDHAAACENGLRS